MTNQPSTRSQEFAPSSGWHDSDVGEDMNYTTIAAQIEFGLDTIDTNRTVEVNLRDLMYVE
jgi:hypothetical protein